MVEIQFWKLSRSTSIRNKTNKHDKSESYHSTSHGKLLAEHSPTILPLASAGSVCQRSTLSCSTKMEQASTKGQNFFHTAIINPLYFSQTKKLHDHQLDASSKFQKPKFFNHIYNNLNLHKKFSSQHSHLYIHMYSILQPF